MVKFYTIGYEGKSLAKLVEILKANAIQLLVDIRANPYSKKEGFTKHELASALTENGIEYMHMGRLGCPRQLRVQAHMTKDYVRYFAEYEAHLTGQRYILQQLAAVAKQKATCLLCLEKRLDRCHRLAVARALCLLDNQLEVEHL